MAYFKPLAQGVSSSSSDFFRTLFVQMLRRERGRQSRRGRAAPGLLCRQQLTCTGGGPGCQQRQKDAAATPCHQPDHPVQRGSPNLTGSPHIEELQVRWGQSIQASVLPSKGSKYLSRGQATALTSIPRTDGSAVHRGSSHTYGKTHWSQDKSQPDPAANTSEAQRRLEKGAGKWSCTHDGPSPSTVPVSPAPSATPIREWKQPLCTDQIFTSLN